jgi:hypothetical protein
VLIDGEYQSLHPLELLSLCHPIVPIHGKDLNPVDGNLMSASLTSLAYVSTVKVLGWAKMEEEVGPRDKDCKGFHPYSSSGFD